MLNLSKVEEQFKTDKTKSPKFLNKVFFAEALPRREAAIIQT